MLNLKVTCRLTYKLALWLFSVYRNKTMLPCCSKVLSSTSYFKAGINWLFVHYILVRLRISHFIMIYNMGLLGHFTRHFFRVRACARDKTKTLRLGIYIRNAEWKTFKVVGQHAFTSTKYTHLLTRCGPICLQNYCKKK